MTVYVLIHDTSTYDDYRIAVEGVYSSKEKAKAATQLLDVRFAENFVERSGKGHCYYVEEHEIDE